MQPDAVAGLWRDLGTEVVSGRNSLPALVVATDVTHPPLRLRLQDAGSRLPQRTVRDGGLVQVIVDEDGTEYYRARFRVARLGADHLDVELPAPPAGLMLQVALDHKRLAWRLIEPGESKATEPSSPPSNNVVRLTLGPGLAVQSGLLDMTYRLAAGRPVGSWPWRNRLLPPVIHDAVLLGRLHWEITLSSRLVGFVLTGDAFAEQHHDWYGGPPPPSAVSAAEFEQRFAAGGSQSPAAEPNIVCWRTNLAPLTLFRVPWQMWLLVCSGMVLGGGLLMSFAPRARVALGFFAVALALGVGTVVVLWPAALPYVLFGCLPGTGLLIVLLAIQWMIHRQYRRQLVFMPGFTRLKSGSSLIRTDGSRPPPPVEGTEGKVREGWPREPSTIDVGPPTGGEASSQGKNAPRP
jgi:hypothetical protein